MSERKQCRDNLKTKQNRHGYNMGLGIVDGPQIIFKSEYFSLLRHTDIRPLIKIVDKADSHVYLRTDIRCCPLLCWAHRINSVVCHIVAVCVIGGSSSNSSPVVSQHCYGPNTVHEDIIYIFLFCNQIWIWENRLKEVRQLPKLFLLAV